ncbi:hypothetical protein D3C73_953750 [compost metagenome]
MLRVQLRSAGTVKLCPLSGEVQRDLGEVVGHYRAAGNVHYGRNGDPARVVGEAAEVRFLQSFNAQDGIFALRVHIKSPGSGIVGGAGLAEADDILKSQEPTDNDGPVGPGAGPRRNQPIPAGFHWPTRFAVGS